MFCDLIGIAVSEIAKSCERVYKEFGLVLQLGAVGHGVGVGLHEHPIINRLSEEKLAEGMVLCIEPSDVKEGFDFEDMILVTDSGFELFTDRVDRTNVPTIS